MSELGNIIQGGGIVVSGALVYKLLDAALKVWATRHQKTKVEPQPLAVELAQRYVTCEQCAAKHAEVDKRFQIGTTTFREMRTELSAIRHEIQDGFSKLNDRISPVAEACAANSAAIQIMLKGPVK